LLDDFDEWWARIPAAMRFRMMLYSVVPQNLLEMCPAGSTLLACISEFGSLVRCSPLLFADYQR
jgi:hypothetical protein